jgi:hypothetical protein
MTGEVWRDVPSVPGVLVSSEGRVMHTPHREPAPHGATRPYGGTPHFGVWNKQDARFILLIRGKTHKVLDWWPKLFMGRPLLMGRLLCTSMRTLPIIGHPIFGGEAKKKT